MFDDLYSKLTEKADYKLLLFVPILLSIILIGVIYFNGFNMGIDFSGGTWMEVVPVQDFGEEELGALESGFADLGLEDLEIYRGTDLVSGNDKITVVTTSQVNQTLVKEIFTKVIGEIFEIDTARIQVSERPPADILDKLAVRFSSDVFYDQASSSIVFEGFDLDSEKLERVTESYLEEDLDVSIQKKNLNIKPVGQTLGKTFREQGVKSVIMAYLLIILVIFTAFRDVIPSLAVILAGTCDAIIALGGMSVFGIVLEPVSLVALLMLVGYSVDSDILLTTRVLKNKTGTVLERIDDAMKTGLTMTGTTLAVMLVIIVMSTFMFQIEVLSIIASVLLIGLVGDLMTTWFMNAGILRWYVEEKGGKLGLRSLGGRLR